MRKIQWGMAAAAFIWLSGTAPLPRKSVPQPQRHAQPATTPILAPTLDPLFDVPMPTASVSPLSARQPASQRARVKVNVVPILPREVVAPKETRAGENIAITVAGDYRNTCYRAGPMSSETDHGRKRVLIRNMAYFSGDCVCLMMLVPYSHSIAIGALETGTYAIDLLNEKGQPQTMAEIKVQ